MRRLIVLTLFLVGAQANAAAILKPTGSFMQSVDDTGTSKVTRSRTVIELPFGYFFENEFGFLGMYSTEKGLAKTDGTSGGTQTDMSRTGYGAGLGWMSSSDIGVYFHAFYYFTSEMTEGSTTYKGTGYQGDLGIKFPVKRAFLALQFSFKQYEYTRTTTGGAETSLSSPRKMQYFDPQAAIIVAF